MKKIALVCMLLAVACFAFAGQVEVKDQGAKRAQIEAKQEVAKPAKPVVEKPVKLDDAALKAMEGDIYSPNLVMPGSLDDCTTPFPEGFEDPTVPPALPACWAEFDVNADTKTWDTYAAGTGAHGGTQIARIQYNGSMAMDDWMISPGVDLTGGTEYQLKYWYKAYSSSYDERLEVKYGTSQDVAGMTTTIVSAYTFSTTTWTEMVATFTPGATGTYYVGFHGMSDMDTYYIYLDDVDLIEAPTDPGRCCYYPDDPCTPVCVENLQGECLALGGTWAMGEHCDVDFPYGCAVPEPTDECCNAGAIGAFPFYVLIDNSTMTTDAPGTCVYPAPNHNVWYTFVGDGYFYTASTCGAEGDLNDTRLQVWSGDCDALVCVDGNDDFGCTEGSTLRSEVTWCAEMGVTYYITTGSYSTTTVGTFPLNVTKGANCNEGRCCYGPDPENPLCVVNTQADCDLLSGDWTAGEVCLPDFPYGCELPFHGEDCDDPLVITTLPYNHSGTQGEVDDYRFLSGEITCVTYYYTNGLDVIYELVIDVDKCITIDVVQGSSDYVSVTLWDDCPDVGTCLAGAASGSADLSIPCTELAAGTYYIMIDNWPTPNDFVYDLTVDECECPSECTEWVNCGTPTETEPNNVCDTEVDPYVIGCDDVVYGLICPEEEVDVYLVVIPPMSYFQMDFFDGVDCDADPPVCVRCDVLSYSDCSVLLADNIVGWYVENTDPDYSIGVYVQMKSIGGCQATYKIETLCCSLAGIDYCGSPIMLPLTDSYQVTMNTGTGANAVPFSGSDCVNQYSRSGNDLVFAFQAPFGHACNVDIDVYYLGADESFWLFTDCADPEGTCVASADDEYDGAGGTNHETRTGIALTPGTIYYLQAGRYSGCGLLTVTISSDCILPVNFLGADAIAGNGRVTVNWTTAGESDLDRYEVVRDGEMVKSMAAYNTPENHSYSWIDTDVTNGMAYSYDIVAYSLSGASDVLATVNATPSFEAGAVSEYALHQNYPNPFNPTTTMAFDLKDAGFVNLTVFNLMGQEVAKVVNSEMSAGRHTVNFNSGSLSSGIYLYRIEVNGFAAERKMLLMK